MELVSIKDGVAVVTTTEAEMNATLRSLLKPQAEYRRVIIWVDGAQRYIANFERGSDERNSGWRLYVAPSTPVPPAARDWATSILNELSNGTAEAGDLYITMMQRLELCKDADVRAYGVKLVRCFGLDRLPGTAGLRP